MANNDWDALQLEITCKLLDWQLSALSQVLNSFLSSLPTVENLKIIVSHKDWQGKIEVIQWREFLHPFTSVKKMALTREDSIWLVAPALQELAVERATMLVLPRLGSEPARQAEAGRFATRLTGPILGKVAVPMTVDST